MSNRSAWRGLCEAVHLTALGLWAGSLVMAGITAAMIFPTVKELSPTLPDYSQYTGAHWRIAAGHVAARVFIACDTVQFIAAFLAAVSLVLLILIAKAPLRRPSMLARLAAFILAIGTLGYHLFFFAPGFNTTMMSYWGAAKAGDNAEAQRLHQIVTDDHPTASNIMGGTAVAVLAALMIGAWCAATPERARTQASSRVKTGTPQTRVTSEPHLEEPALLKGSKP